MHKLGCFELHVTENTTDSGLALRRLLCPIKEDTNSSVISRILFIISSAASWYFNFCLLADSLQSPPMASIVTGITGRQQVLGEKGNCSFSWTCFMNKKIPSLFLGPNYITHFWQSQSLARRRELPNGLMLINIPLFSTFLNTP